MTRVGRWRKYSVYVYPERGGRHHSPHAHVKYGGQRVASIFLDTLELYGVLKGERLPRELLEWIAENQEALLDVWENLNGDDA